MEKLYYIRQAKEIEKLQLILAETSVARMFHKEYMQGKTRTGGVWLVKDQGAYLMSAAVVTKAMLAKTSPGEQRIVSYFDEFPANVDFKRQQQAWGGDDFCLLLDVHPKTLDFIRVGRQVVSARARVGLENGRLSSLSIAFNFGK